MNVLKKKKDKITIRSSVAEYLTYVASVGDQRDSIEMRYADGEIDENSVIRKFRITASDGKSYNTNHYSLEMIIAVGFKVNSERAVQFRKWVNQIAKDYTIKGWVMDDERLNPPL